MSQTPVVHIRPQDLAPQQFMVDPTSKKLKILPVSTDANNIVTAGSDGLVFVGAGAIQANQVIFSASLAGDKLQFFKTVPGVGGAAPTTTMINQVDLTPLDVTVNAGSFTNGILTLNETNGGQSVTIDLTSVLRSVATAASTSATIAGNGTPSSPLVISVTIDTSIQADKNSGLANLVKVSASGVGVNPSDVLALINANITNVLALDTTNGYLTSTINGTKAQLAIVEVTGLDGSHQGYMLA